MPSVPQQEKRDEQRQTQRARGARERESHPLAAKHRQHAPIEVARIAAASQKSDADEIVRRVLFLDAERCDAQRTLRGIGVPPPQERDEPSLALEPPGHREAGERDQDQEGRSDEAATKEQMGLRSSRSASA